MRLSPGENTTPNLEQNDELKVNTGLDYQGVVNLFQLSKWLSCLGKKGDK